MNERNFRNLHNKPPLGKPLRRMNDENYGNFFQFNCFFAQILGGFRRNTYLCKRKLTHNDYVVQSNSTT